MSQKFTVEQIQSRMPEIMDGFRKVLKENGFPGVEISVIRFHSAEQFKALHAETTDCVWKTVCHPVSGGMQCELKCV